MGKRRTEIHKPNVLEIADFELEFFLDVEPLEVEDLALESVDACSEATPSSS